MKITNEIIYNIVQKQFKEEQFQIQQIHQYTPTFLQASMIEEETDIVFKKYNSILKFLDNYKNDDLQFLVFWNAVEFKTLEKIEHIKIENEEALAKHFKQSKSYNYICLYEDIIVVRVGDDNRMFNLVDFIDEIKPHLLFEDFQNKFRTTVKKQKVNKI